VIVDQIGTPQAATDRSGNLVWRAVYDPFGAAAVDSDPDGDGAHTVLNLRFAGQYFDAETGLHDNYFRSYSPEGRYLQSDPIGMVGGANTYTYVGARPLTSMDPSGLVEWSGTQTTVSVLTGEAVFYDLQSQCINGDKWLVELSGGGLNLGLSPSKAGIINWTIQPVQFGDIWDGLVDPEEVFGGWYFGVDATIAVPGLAGVGCSATVLGMDAPWVGAQSAGCSGVSGFKAGAGLSFGHYNIKKQKVKCNDCEKPIAY
jgi:RHS repeat-associated protein